jgi:DNA invertase Pin-like site-specific DNA recombinase
MPQRKIVTYYRVSTARQGKSGLGLEAQRTAVSNFLMGKAWHTVGQFTEVETGKRNDRPELQSALDLAKRTGATLVVAKLDRLSRNAAFLLTLRDSAVDFVCADMPDANRLTIGILAMVAEQEREAISARTKAALMVARARGVRLGNPRGAEPLRQAGKGNHAALQARIEKADHFAQDILTIVAPMRDAGMSLNAIALNFNQRGYLTARSGKWTATAVRRVLARAG